MSDQTTQQVLVALSNLLLHIGAWDEAVSVRAVAGAAGHLVAPGRLVPRHIAARRVRAVAVS